ncbi:hypothetical protein DSLASN_04980 [Desulfoluna limicola]|uniref:PAS domain S-box protein n=1 Tax=Desulfoluna limicola TaxID=2810562 RepID=A0ABM7PBH4_9BACT|nr:ATP-binding protein [Desulfoluna limicola]BCS94866.1 hypothetical protein DSLASN_04980 [Desulfoluna limicola]
MTKSVKDTDNWVTMSVCPHTGLATYTRPEWTDVIFGMDYSLSLTIIGDRILFVKIKGHSTLDVVANSTEFTKKIIAECFSPKKELFYIGDFSGITGITKSAKKYYIDYLSNLSQLNSFILCSSSPFMMLAGNLSKRFNIIKFSLRVEKDYSTAVRQAAFMANQVTCSPDDHVPHIDAPQDSSATAPPDHWGLGRLIHKIVSFPRTRRALPVRLTRVTRKEWRQDFENCSIQFELINGNIIHKVSKGYLSVDLVRPIYALQDDIIRSCGLSGQPYYLVNGVKDLQESSLKARKKYSRLFSEWLDEHPDLREVVVYGANRLLRAALSIAMYSKPCSIVFASDFEEAMAIVQDSKEHTPLRRSRCFMGKKRRKDTVKRYADELNCFLGNINWEVEGASELVEEKSDDHPFKNVYDAIALIKADIDELFRDREMAQVALRESEEVSRALLNATRDLSLLVQADGTIISVNQPFATALGQTTEALKGKQLANFLRQQTVDHALSHIKEVVETAEPYLFETNLDGRHYQNTIYPVFNADKKVDRLALYSRDITGLKQAQEQIHGLTQQLIKAQENERRRIARDLHDNVAQDLASLIISNDSLFDDFEEIPLKVRQRNSTFSGVLKKTIASIRDLVYDLRPPGLTQIGLVKTMDQYCIDFSKKYDIEIDLYTAGTERLNLDTDTKINLFRILQEALNNANNHAGATLISVRLIASHPDLILRIEDNGCGFDPDVRMVTALKEKRMGLKSMEERVNLLEGELTIRSQKGSGTRIVVKFPYNQKL